MLSDVLTLWIGVAIFQIESWNRRERLPCTSVTRPVELFTRDYPSRLGEIMSVFSS